MNCTEIQLADRVRMLGGSCAVCKKQNMYVYYIHIQHTVLLFDFGQDLSSHENLQVFCSIGNYLHWIVNTPVAYIFKIDYIPSYVQAI